MNKREEFLKYNARSEFSVGDIVAKKSGKPFKSGYKNARIMSFGSHPITGYDVFYFEEDDSYVECFRCVLVLKGKL